MGSSSDSQDGFPKKLDEDQGPAEAVTPQTDNGNGHAHDLPTVKPLPSEQQRIESLLADIRDEMSKNGVDEDAIALLLDDALRLDAVAEGTPGSLPQISIPVLQPTDVKDDPLQDLITSLTEEPDPGPFDELPDPAGDLALPLDDVDKESETQKLEEVKKIVKMCTEFYKSFCDTDFDSLKAEAGFFQAINGVPELEMYELMFAVIKRFTMFMERFLVKKQLNAVADKLCYVADRKIDHVAHVDRQNNTLLMQPGMLDYFQRIQAIIENAEIREPSEDLLDRFIVMIDMNAL